MNEIGIFNMKKKKNFKPKCKHIYLGNGIKFEICNDHILNSKDYFFSVEDGYKHFIGSCITKQYLKKLANTILKFIDS